MSPSWKWVAAGQRKVHESPTAYATPSTAIVFDSDLNLHSVEQLRELARVGVQFDIVEVETDEDVTQTLLA